MLWAKGGVRTTILVVPITLEFVAYARDDLLEVLLIGVEERHRGAVHLHRSVLWRCLTAYRHKSTLPEGYSR